MENKKCQNTTWSCPQITQITPIKRVWAADLVHLHHVKAIGVIVVIGVICGSLHLDRNPLDNASVCVSELIDHDECTCIYFVNQFFYASDLQSSYYAKQNILFCITYSATPLEDSHTTTQSRAV